MNFRDFVPADQEQARAVIQGGLQDRWGHSFDANVNIDTDDIAASYTTGRDRFVVAVDQLGNVVGTGALVAEKDEPVAGRMVRISVDAANRRQGIARSIVYQLISRAEAAGYEVLRVVTDTPWTDAIALYRSCGFTFVAEDEVESHLELPLVQYP